MLHSVKQCLRFSTKKLMLLIFVIIAGLVGWALHLMEEAIERREFSLMLAGFLVASSAAALVAVYFFMIDYIDYMNAPVFSPI